jgi:hypothetical protein
LSLLSLFLQVVNHIAFTYFFNLMVVVSCVILTLDVVSLDQKSKKAIVLRNLDAATLAVFGIEVRFRDATSFISASR